MPRPAQPQPETTDTTEAPPSSSETLRYSIGGGRARTVEVVDGNAEVATQAEADTLNTVVDGVKFTVRPAQEK